MDDGRARVLAERQDALRSRFGVAEELQGYVFVVFRSLRVFENLGHLEVVFAAEHKLHVVESLLGHHRERFLAHLQNGFAFKFGSADAFFRKQAVFRCVFAELEHRRVFEFWNLCHDVCVFFCRGARGVPVEYLNC